ncbi:MAG: DNA cytosine methyltransferase [Candidatus Aenigmarchaeota archaeon]|nr:DNA cytosine methyltransferase [Candidatus Aenigmarchaeota archaeon]
MKKNVINVVSLFSGCGGLDLGFEIANHAFHEFKVIWANDIFRPSCKTYSENFGLEIYEDPNEVLEKPKIFCGDIEKIDFQKISNGKVIDVIAGGPPCQDFSLIRGKGKRLGTKVKRGRLYSHFVRALISLQPKIFVFENVKGLVSANNGMAYKEIIEDFQNLDVRYPEIEGNYEKLENNIIEKYEIVFSDIVDFSKLGVPQKRERLIIIGIRKDLVKKLPNDIDEIRKYVKEKLCSGNKILSLFPITPIEIFSGESFGSLKNEYTSIMQNYKTEIEEIKSKRSVYFLKNIWSKYSFKIWEDYKFINKLNGELNQEEVEKEHEKIMKLIGFYKKPLDRLFFDDNSNDKLVDKNHVKSRMSCIPPGENHRFVRGTEHEVAGLMSNIYKRLHPLKPSPTVIGRGGGGTWGYHYRKDRQKLTNRERARLQTFPDYFKFKGKSSDVRRQIGEAVPPLASKIIAEFILKIFI